MSRSRLGGQTGAQARVDQEIDDVDDEVHTTKTSPTKHEIGRHHRDIDHLDGLDEQRAETGQLNTVSVRWQRRSPSPVAAR